MRQANTRSTKPNRAMQIIKVAGTLAILGAVTYAIVSVGGIAMLPGGTVIAVGKVAKVLATGA
ncbi:MAG: hypothetical protein KAI47_22885 [Deltaproteobacteria bacterium]|nr:hypothetical protein [Deltaproteobacteria bacterium]